MTGGVGDGPAGNGEHIVGIVASYDVGVHTKQLTCKLRVTTKYVKLGLECATGMQTCSVANSPLCICNPYVNTECCTLVLVS